MSLIHVKSKLSAYAAGEVGARARQKIAHHLSHCAACSTAYKVIQQGSQFARQISVRAPSDEVWHQIKHNILSSNSVGSAAVVRRRARRAYWPQLAGALALLLVVATAWWTIQRGLLRTPNTIGLDGFITIIERAMPNDVVRAAARSLKGFYVTPQERAFAIAGVTDVSDRLPLDGVSLTGTRMRTIETQEVVELTYSLHGQSFAVFVAPASVDFSFGERLITPAQLEDIACRSVQSETARTYWFGAGGFHCVLVSQLQDERQNAAIVRYFVKAHEELQ